MIFLISYDLKIPGRNYTNLYDAIKSIGLTFHPLESVWFLKSNLKPNDIYSKLRPHIDDNDYIFIVDISKRDRQGWMAKSAWEWLKQNDI